MAFFIDNIQYTLAHLQNQVTVFPRLTLQYFFNSKLFIILANWSLTWLDYKKSEMKNKLG